MVSAKCLKVEGRKDERRETEEGREGGRGDGSYKGKLGAHTSQVEMEVTTWIWKMTEPGVNQEPGALNLTLPSICHMNFKNSIPNLLVAYVSEKQNSDLTKVIWTFLSLLSFLELNRFYITLGSLWTGLCQSTPEGPWNLGSLLKLSYNTCVLEIWPELVKDQPNLLDANV